MLIYPGLPKLPNVEQAGLKFVMPTPNCKIIIIHCCYCCYCSETRSNVTQAGFDFPFPWPLSPEGWGFSCIGCAQPMQIFKQYIPTLSQILTNTVVSLQFCAPDFL